MPDDLGGVAWHGYQLHDAVVVLVSEEIDEAGDGAGCGGVGIIASELLFVGVGVLVLRRRRRQSECRYIVVLEVLFQILEVSPFGVMEKDDRVDVVTPDMQR